MTLQATASKTALLLQCPRPFSKDTEIPPREDSEAAEYGTRFHTGMAWALTHQSALQGLNVVLDRFPADAAELAAHILRAFEELQAWMRPSGNPFGKQFRVVEVETSRALSLKADGITVVTPTTLIDPDGDHHYNMYAGEIGGTCDVVLESDDGMIVVLDHKTGEFGDFTRPASIPQMQTLGEMWRAEAVAILHAPKLTAPAIYAEALPDSPKHRAALRSALRRVDSGFLRPGPECGHCPARLDCPAKQGELVVSASALVHKVVGSSMARTDIAEPGRFHMMLGELSRLAKMARNELQEQVRAGAIIERPDGKTLELIEKTVERVSKSSILKAYGPEEGERVLTKLRADGALVAETHEELRAR